MSMYGNNTILGLITARGGSKGLPGKNVKNLMGKPLIAWTIEQALKSEYLDRVVVSTEDHQIADISKGYGAEVPFIRPKELATDAASNIDVVIHAVNQLKDDKFLPDSVMLLQPTSPLRRREDIDRAIELFYSSNTDTLVSVHMMVEHPYECLKLEKGGWSYLASPKSNVTRRQEYGEDFFYINGAIYLAKIDFLLEKKTFLVENDTALYFMHPAFGTDIDDIFDFRRAEFYFQHRDEFSE